jgi:hypothetical protein
MGGTFVVVAIAGGVMISSVWCVAHMFHNVGNLLFETAGDFSVTLLNSAH